MTMDLNIRRGTLSDLDPILNIERSVFPLFQQSSVRTVTLSLRSSFQQVWVAVCTNEGESEICGVLILYAYKKTLRIYSIATSKKFQGKGIGDALLWHAESIAGISGYERLSLEAEANNRKLIEWYKRRGFEVLELSKDYYEEGIDAYKMVKILSVRPSLNRITNVIVTDHSE